MRNTYFANAILKHPEAIFVFIAVIFTHEEPLSVEITALLLLKYAPLKVMLLFTTSYVFNV